MPERGRPEREQESRSRTDAPGRGRRDPLLGIERLVVDGTNVVHALGGGQEAATTSLVGRLRSVVPAPIAIDLVFDGPPAPGLGRRIGPGLTVHHAADRPADDLIVGLVAAAVDRASRVGSRPLRADRSSPRAASGSRSTPAVLVVTDDADLRRRVRLRGAVTAPASWLVARLARPRPVAPAAGNRRAPTPLRSGTESRAGGATPDGARPPEEAERPPWRPGRGATTKRGNPRRRSRRDVGRAG